MNKPNRNGTYIMAARAIRPATVLFVVSVVAGGAVVAVDPLLGQPPQPEVQQPERPYTRRVPRTVTVQDADGTRRTHTEYVEEQVLAVPQNVPTRVPQTVITAFPQTETDRRSLELAARLRQTEDAAEQKRLRGELTELLSKAFDERRKAQQQEMKRLEASLQSIRELDRRREELKDKIVQRRLNELLGKDDELAWEPAPPATIVAPPIYSPVPSPQTYMPYPGPAPIPYAYGDTRPERDARISERADDVPPGTTPPAPQQPFSIRGEQSLDLAERILTLASEIALWRNRIAGTEKVLEDIKTRAAQLPPPEQLEGVQAGHEEVLAAYRSSLVQSETKLRLAQIAWEGLGAQLEREFEGAGRQRLAVEKQIKLHSRRFEEGEITVESMEEAKAAREAAVSKHEVAESRLDTWKQSDRILQERLKAILTTDAEPAEPEDAERETADMPAADAAEDDPS